MEERKEASEKDSLEDAPVDVDDTLGGVPLLAATLLQCHLRVGTLPSRIGGARVAFDCAVHPPRRRTA